MCKQLICVIKLQVHRHLSLNRERKRKILKDEKKHHDAVDESSLEQEFRKLCEKSGAILLALVRLTAVKPGGWEATSQMKY